jgi:hypothetical protein
MSYNHSSTNLLQGQITADEDPISAAEQGRATYQAPSAQASAPKVQLGSISGSGSGSGGGSNQDDQQGILAQSAHPVALIFLYLFRCSAVATYLLCGFFSSSYVFSVST